MSKEFCVTARGKVNISLNITGERDGLHTLDSVTSAVGIYDVVNISFDSTGRTRVEFCDGGGELGNCPPVGERNTVSAALQYLRRFVPDMGAAVKVVKRIPVGGGLGGSSADAAAVIAAAAAFYGLDGVISGGVCVGSDVPMTAVGGYLRVGGTGEKLAPFKAKPLSMVIATLGGEVSSREAYAEFDRLHKDKIYCPSNSELLIRGLQSGDADLIGGNARNALYGAAVRLNGGIERLMQYIDGQGAYGAFMSGSGSCCCGLFADMAAARRAADNLKRFGAFAEAVSTCGEGCTVERM